MPLDRLLENRWDLGEFHAGASELEPEGSAETILGLLGDDGLPFRRGGSVYQSTSAAGSAGLTWIADANLLAGRRTLFGNSTGLYTLDTNDATPLQITAQSPPAYPAPVRVWVLNGAAYVEPDTTGKEVVWGGSRKAVYTTGTASVATDDTVVTGSGTGWLANAEAGMFIGFNGGETASLIKSVDSDTQLTLRLPYRGGAVTGGTFQISPTHSSTITNPSPVYYGVAGNRVLRTNGPSRMDFTQVNNDGAADPDDYHQFPEAIRGFGAVRDVAMVFTTGGVWAVSGLAFPIEDSNGNPQHRKELVNQDLILWDRLGIATYQGALVVPALDNVYVLDSLGAPTAVGGRILDLYLQYVRAGYRCGGGEVFAGHYWLPILNGTTWVDTLVCRLLPTHSGTQFSWTRLAGAGGEVAGFAERVGSPPKLLAASRRTTSRVLDATGYLNPSATVKSDADGSAHQFQLTTRDIPTGGLVENSVLYIQLAYSLTDAASDDPTLTAEVNPDGTGWQALEGEAPEGTPDTPFVWPCSVAARHMRFRFTCTDPAASLKVEALSIYCRKSGRYL